MLKECYMRRAIQLAKTGLGRTSPNPMVGAVIVKENRIIGEGCHQGCGTPHAERNALSSCTEDPAGAVMYVTLEPCCHTGRTPPCTQAILESHIAHVVIGSRDPNPRVAGMGIKLLRENGITVTENYLQNECEAVNPVFFHYIQTGQPYVAMKYAMTADGKTATCTGASKWITGEKARAHVHTLRHQYTGIMVGIGTVLADNPLLSCRMDGGRQPVRIICDSRLRIPPHSHIYSTADQYPTICAYVHAESKRISALKAQGITPLKIPHSNGRIDLSSLMDALGHMEIDSILLEGGGTLNESMLRAGLVQKIYCYIAPKLLGGQKAKTPVEGHGFSLLSKGIQLSAPKISVFDQDLLLEYEVIPAIKNLLPPAL